MPRSLASDAASSAIEAGDLETAVELLEQGRTILWSKIRGYRHSLDNLRDVNGDLANQFDRVSRELEHHAISSDVDSAQPGLYDRQTRKHRLLSEKWDAVVGQIRQLDGFTNFLQAIPFTNLQPAATEGPVIIVNISRYRSDAIILLKSHPPVLVCLPDASPDALRELSETLSSSLILESNSLSIILILRELWDLVVSPVVDQLTVLGVIENSRIWWCPTAELCALPLHAAGPYISGHKNLPDIYISSYTPSLSSLIRARSDLAGRLTGPKLLVMGQPNDHLKLAQLPQVREEIRRIQSLDNSVNVLLGEQANRETILHCLQQYPWIHFACHGHRSPAAPFLSYFQLHDDERLTLVDLMQARLPNADLAFLSACHSASINVNSTPDEAIHLAAALQFCGFRSVVGTLWAMADIDGPDIAEDFYRYMFRKQGAGGDFRDSAAALNHATRAMRIRRVPVDRWVNFVHIGA
jgi:CHAT domain-containing protein